ncbi:MAG: peptide deformylase [Deltaproteobacteria bacterium]|nr:peptide deformylase [Deltaproteobacteria bacterium]
MSEFEILKYPDPFLRKKASRVERVDSSVRRLVEDMVETMRRAKGVGLAATQVGVDKRVVVLDVPLIGVNEDICEELEERERVLLKLINPEIVASGGEIEYEEGCLSLPGITADVVRAAEVTIRALDADGRGFEMKAGGLPAIALQHEIDHLDGVLFIDRLSRLKRELLVRKYRKAMAAEAV